MHDEARTWLRDTISGMRPTQVVELGSRNINGTTRDLVDPDVPYLGVDHLPGLGVDVIGDAETVEPEVVPDLVICAETLEHAAYPARVVANGVRMLAAGGSLVMTCAGPSRAPHSAIDGGAIRPGEHYAGIACDELVRWCLECGAEVVTAEDHPSRGDVYVHARKTRLG